MTEWRWVALRDVLAIHDIQLAEHGGVGGIRDSGALESELAQAQNLAATGEPDYAELAVAYAFGIAKNHPFVDGNKRTALVTLEFFLELNGYVLGADDVQCVVTVSSLADGMLSESELAGWLRGNCTPG